MIVLRSVSSQRDVETVALKINEAAAQSIKVLGVPIEIGASIGIVMYPDHTQDEEKLRVFADRAMYAAKAEHNCYRVFSPEMESPVTD